MQFTSAQSAFIDWNAERLGISQDSSRARLRESILAFPDGHGGQGYRRFCDLSYRVFSVFADDSPFEVFSSYQLHAELHFLRMLSYPDIEFDDAHPIISSLQSSRVVDILDFGCGLAQTSRAIARRLRYRGQNALLHLADIPTLRKDFLLWMLGRDGMRVNFYDCLPDKTPILPDCDICIATEFFEHVHHPLDYLNAFDAAMRPGAFLITNLARHNPEFMHVYPDLSPLRNDIIARGYCELVVNSLYRKPCPWPSRASV